MIQPLSQKKGHLCGLLMPHHLEPGLIHRPAPHNRRSLAPADPETPSDPCPSQIRPSQPPPRKVCFSIDPPPSGVLAAQRCTCTAAVYLYRQCRHRQGKHAKRYALVPSPPLGERVRVRGKKTPPPYRHFYTGISICTLIDVGGIFLAKSNASIPSRNAKRSVIMGLTSVLPLPNSATARG